MISSYCKTQAAVRFIKMSARRGDRAWNCHSKVNWLQASRQGLPTSTPISSHSYTTCTAVMRVSSRTPTPQWNCKVSRVYESHYAAGYATVNWRMEFKQNKGGGRGVNSRASTNVFDRRYNASLIINEPTAVMRNPHLDAISRRGHVEYTF